MKRIEQVVQAHYADKKLPAERVEALLQQGSGRHKLRRRIWTMAVAAALVVACMGLYGHLQQEALSERVIAEVAMNHRKNLAVEVASGRYEAVQQQLDRLEFSILPAAAELGPTYALVGGRYCSIQGQLAAQLKVRDEGIGQIRTLYVASMNSALAEIVPREEILDGMQIRLWSANGRFFALIGAAEQ